MQKKAAGIALVFVLFVLTASLLLSGCKDKTQTTTQIKTVDDSGSGATQQAQTDAGQSNAQTGQQEQQAQNQTTQPQPEEEQVFPLQYTLADMGEFIKNMDYLIGADAPASDVISVTNMKTYLIYKGIETGDAKVTSDIVDYKRDDYMIIGSPCDNPAAADFFRKEVAAKGNCKIFPEGEARIKLKAVSNNHFMLYIGGNTPSETKKAMTVVQYFSNYTLNGTEAKVTGTAESPVVSVIQ